MATIILYNPRINLNVIKLHLKNSHRTFKILHTKRKSINNGAISSSDTTHVSFSHSLPTYSTHLSKHILVKKVIGKNGTWEEEQRRNIIKNSKSLLSITRNKSTTCSRMFPSWCFSFIPGIHKIRCRWKSYRERDDICYAAVHLACRWQIYKR